MTLINAISKLGSVNMSSVSTGSVSSFSGLGLGQSGNHLSLAIKSATNLDTNLNAQLGSATNITAGATVQHITNIDTN